MSKNEMVAYSIGYGGRKKDEFLGPLVKHGVRTVVDCRLHPNHASMGMYVLAQNPTHGIQKLLGEAGIAYASYPDDLGNPFCQVKNPDIWVPQFSEHFLATASHRTAWVDVVEHPFCLLCACKYLEVVKRGTSEVNCHRKIIADYLAENREFRFTHL